MENGWQAIWESPQTYLLLILWYVKQKFFIQEVPVEQKLWILCSESEEVDGDSRAFFPNKSWAVMQDDGREGIVGWMFSVVAATR